MEQSGELTRHLKPLKESTFSDFEVLQVRQRCLSKQSFNKKIPR